MNSANFHRQLLVTHKFKKTLQLYGRYILAKNRKSRVGLIFCCFFFFRFFLLFFLLVFLLTIFRCSNNFKNFKKYPDTFRLLYDKGETSNQHDNKKLNKVIGIESHHYERI